jgi:hypothetical protein
MEDPTQAESKTDTVAPILQVLRKLMLEPIMTESIIDMLLPPVTVPRKLIELPMAAKLRMLMHEPILDCFLKERPEPSVIASKIDIEDPQ